MFSKVLKNTVGPGTCTVPPWLVGVWRRNWIKDSSGNIDNTTHVIYAQTNSGYIDFRVPDSIISNRQQFNAPSQSIFRPFINYEVDHYLTLSSQLCDAGICNVNDTTNDSFLSSNEKFIFADNSKINNNIIPIARWNASMNYQLHTEYPEDGILTHDINNNNIMYEQPPSMEYLECWELLNKDNNNYYYFDLIKECDIDDCNFILRNKGCMILFNDYFFIVRDRKLDFYNQLQSIKDKINNDNIKLEELMNQYKKDEEFLKLCVDMEFSYGIRNIKNTDNISYKIQLSSVPFLIGIHVNMFDETHWKRIDDNIWQETDYTRRVKRIWQLSHSNSPVDVI